MLRYGFECEVTKSLSDEGDVYSFIISSENVDRVGDRMVLDGVDLKDFNKHPLVYYNHNRDAKPIGQAKKVTSEYDVMKGRVLKGDVIFNMVTRDSQEVKELVDMGHIKYASIGFEPIEYHDEPIPNELKSKLPKWINNIRVYDKWKLQEFSIVDMPANIDAEFDRLKYKGLDINEEINKFYNKKEEAMNENSNPEVVEKVGRVFSKSNYTALLTIKAMLDDLVKQMEAEEPTDDVEETVDESKSIDLSEIKESIVNELGFEIDELKAAIAEMRAAQKQDSEAKSLTIDELRKLIKGE